ncbi:MAG: DUF1957 domain-containing protein, partial [Clostridia bacterium]|nr:DUF1957 domain-containing protein [Clostridia bacterium]
MGYLALILHSHLPFVRDSGTAEILEERWLFEAITNCYIPLLDSWERLEQEGIDFKITVSLSPSLLSMLKDEHLQKKYQCYLERMIALGEKERHKYRNEPDFASLAAGYERQAQNLLSKWEQHQGDLTSRFKRLAEKGRLELITTCATHGYLPLMSSDEARKAQIEVGLATFREIFGFSPRGFWLPECGYLPGIEQFLKEQGIQYFFVDSHGILGAKPAPRYGVYAPLACGEGIWAFGRDPESSRQVWERRLGYPGHPDYREFYRDVGFDETQEYLKEFLPQNIRVDTGYKYYRITGQGDSKEIYQPEIAQQRAAEHAAHFLQSRLHQFDRIAAWMPDRQPVVVAPYDAELFGPWWYEGPLWLESLCRLAAEKKKIDLIIPG